VILKEWIDVSGVGFRLVKPHHEFAAHREGVSTTKTSKRRGVGAGMDARQRLTCCMVISFEKYEVECCSCDRKAAAARSKVIRRRCP
jgi:hypothetical protein